MQRVVPLVKSAARFQPKAFQPLVPRAGAARFQSTSSTTAAESYYSSDTYFESERIDKRHGNPNRRAFAYFVLGGARFLYASATRLAAIKFIATMSASADVLALASAEFKLDAVEPGQTVTLKWRGKPVFIRHRTQEEIDDALNVDVSQLRDPEPDSDRALKPEWLVVLGICTHLGCVPIANAGEYDGWYCPCHGSHYDISGRIRKGPAPLNLEVPPYEFLDDETIKIG